MSSWVNRTVLSGASTAPNGTTSHTCTFTAATSGNLLVAVVAGSVTFTTPSGWTAQVSAVNNTGLYLFTKTASASESSFTTTHNGNNYAVEGIVYEYPSGSSYAGSNSATGQSLNAGVTGPSVTGLTGTYTRFAARSLSMTTGMATESTAWTLPSVEDYDVYTVKASNDGIHLTIAYDDSQTGSSFNPSSNLTADGGATSEAISFALSLPAGMTASFPWLRAS